jgi:2,3-dihydroxybenzoate---[aryl-carrier protein] ligase
MLKGCTPWPDEFARRYRDAGYWEGLSLWGMLERSIGRWPQKIALCHGARRLTYAELGAAIAALSVRLLEQGLRPLDRAVVQLPNGIEFVVAFFALVRIGVIPVLALPAHRRAEIDHFAAHSGAVAYLVADRIRDFDYRPLATQIAAARPALRHVLVLGEAGPGQTSLSALMRIAAPPDAADRLAPHAPASGEVAVMLLSGGTTGLSKLIPRTHDDYVYNARQSATVSGFGPDTVFLAVLPLGHNYSLASPGILGAFYHGGRAVIAEGAAPEAIFPLIARERVTAVAAAVPVLVNWLNSGESARHDLGSLKVLINGGARLAPELRRRAEELFGCTYQENYGTGEGLLCITRLDDGDAERLNSSGEPVSAGDEIRVVDDSDRDLPDGDLGQLVCRGPYTVRGYYNNPEATRAAYTADGFYRMGDAVRKIGRHVYFEGRFKDLVNRGGEKISCEEVENHILAHHGVRAVCVVAMPDAVYGEKACAFVLPQPGTTLTFGELSAFLAGRGIAKFKFPERLEIVEGFPISPAGKILRRELRRMISEKLAAEHAAHG